MKKILLLISLFIISSIHIKAETSDRKLFDDLKQTVVFLGHLKQEIKDKKEYIVPVPTATGFLVGIDNIFHLITAKHVIANKVNNKYKINDENMHVFFNDKNEKLKIRSLSEIKNKYKDDWIFHADPNIDIAIIPFMIDPKKDNLKVIPEDIFIDDINKISELYGVFFLSYQPGIKLRNKIQPIFRSGIISSIQSNDILYIDAAAFPGNSGSPVFIKPSAIRFDKGSIRIGSDPIGGRFIGVISSYITYSDVAISSQTGRPRIVFEENTGISKLITINSIKELIASKEFQKQLQKLKKK